MSFPVGHNLHLLPAKLNAGSDIGFYGDSFSVGEQGSNARFCDQIVNGLPMAAINGTVGLLQDSAAHVLDVKVSTNLTGDVAGTNYENIEAGNSYRLNGFSASTDYWAVPARFGAAFKFDANLAVGTDGLILSCNLPAANAADWDHANSVNTFNVRAGNDHKFRLVHTPTSSGTTHDNDLKLFDGATLRSTQNLNSPAPTYGHANALADVLVQSDSFLVKDTNLTTGTKPNNARSANLVSLLAYRVDASGNFVGGTIPYWLADSSWLISGWGADAASTGNKQFSETQYENWLSAVTVDTTRDSVIFWSLDPEALTAATTKTNVLAAMAVVDTAHDNIGKPRPFHVWIGPHRNGSESSSINTNQGIYDAVVAHGNSGFFSIYKATDGIYFDNSDATEDAFLTGKGANNLTFGTVTSADCTLAAITDGLHTTENGAAFFMSLLKAEMDAATARSNAMTWPNFIENTIGAKHLWRVGEADTTFVDVINGHNAAFTAGFTTGQAGGLIGDADAAILGSGTSDAVTTSPLLLIDGDVAGPWCVGCLIKLNGAPSATRRLWHLGNYHAGGTPDFTTDPAIKRAQIGLQFSTTSLQFIMDGWTSGTITTYTSTPALIDNNWHLLLINYDEANGNPWIKWRLDNGNFANPTSGTPLANEDLSAAVSASYPNWPEMWIMQNFDGAKTNNGIYMDELFAVDGQLSDIQGDDIYDKALVTGFPSSNINPLLRPGLGFGFFD